MKEKKTDNSVQPDKESKYYCPTAYCENCKHEVEYIIHGTRRYGTYEGVRYRYKGKKANCKECGSTVILPEVLAYNLSKLIAKSKKDKYNGAEKDNG